MSEAWVLKTVRSAPVGLSTGVYKPKPVVPEGHGFIPVSFIFAYLFSGLESKDWTINSMGVGPASVSSSTVPRQTSVPRPSSQVE